MDYTQSPDYATHEPTGNRMHQDSAAITTAVSEKDLNSVIWSLMALLEAAGVEGMQFDPDEPDSYGRLLQAIQALIGEHSTPSAIKSLLDVGLATTTGASANQAALVAALAVVRSRLLVPEGEFQVTGDLQNPYGAALSPGGRITKPVTGGRQQLNLSADEGQHVFGQEYLYAFHNKINAQSSGAQAVMVFSGDSTTAPGNGSTSPFVISDIVEILGREAGFKVTSVNRGQSGKNTYHWRTSYLAGDLAASPDLLVLDWGINDPGWLKDNTTPPLDSGQSYPNRRDITDFANDLRGGLATIRAAHGVDVLSILLRVPNSTSDTPNGRDEVWYEQVRRVVRQAARDYKCACIDAYSLWVDSRVAAGLWMDDAFGDGRAIHPHNVMNSWIATVTANLLFPRGLRPSFLGETWGHQYAAARPDDYKIGLNLARCIPADHFPADIDGAVMTIRTPDDMALQIAWDTASLIPLMPAIRFGEAGVWGAWLSRPHQDMAPLGGWSVWGTGTDARVSRNWKMVSVSGALSGGLMVLGTVVCNLPVGARPFATQWFTVACGTNFDQLAVLQVRVNGDIAIQTCPSNGGLSLSGIQFEAFN